VSTTDKLQNSAATGARTSEGSRRWDRDRDGRSDASRLLFRWEDGPKVADSRRAGKRVQRREGAGGASRRELRRQGGSQDGTVRCRGEWRAVTRKSPEAPCSGNGRAMNRKKGSPR